MINVAVIGSGYWGKNLVRNFNELGALHTICDNNIATLRAFQDEYPDKRFQTSYGALRRMIYPQSFIYWKRCPPRSWPREAIT